MKSILPVFVSILCIISHIEAALSILTPKSGQTFTASGSTVNISISWDDDDNVPTASEIKSYTFVLCTGPNDEIKGLGTLKDISPSSINDDSYDAEFEASLGSGGLYYIQIYMPLNNGGHVIKYSERFELSGMTGTYTPSGSGDPPSDTIYDPADAAAAASQSSASFTVPYTLQTGRTRYAPMQMQPGSTITVSSWSRRFPTSAVTYYSTIAGSPVVYSTITPGWSYTMSSLINYATPAPFPSEVGWYPASVRLVSASLDATMGSESKNKLKKRRWID